MEFRRLARSAWAGLSPLASSSSFSSAAAAAAPFRSARLLSTTAARLAQPPIWSTARPPPPPRNSSSSASASASGPGSGTRTPWSPGASSPAQSASASASLNSRYPSDKPADWSSWSTTDFDYGRNNRAQHGSSQRSGSGPGSWSAGAAADDINSLDFNPKTRELPFPLKPEAGRTTYVSHRIDAARAFQLCGMTLSMNRTRNLWMKQRFHERPGLRRKRLASQTWRRKFRSTVVTTVGRVKQLVQQGW